MIKRFQLFEFGDLKWFPNILRDMGTEFLEFGANRFDIYEPVLPIFRRGIDSSTDYRILDIASGGGGGLVKLSEHLKKDFPDLKIRLTDYFPNSNAFQRTIQKDPDVFDSIDFPVDAMDVPHYLKGFRTMFLSFHHFEFEDAKSILQNAIDSNQPIAIFEAQQRNLKSLVPMLLSPLSLILMTPFIRPFRLLRILFTYIIPIMPLIVLWDGVVSVLRTYTVEELNQMTDELNQSDSFCWETGIKNGKMGNIIYLLGLPKK